MSPWRILSTIYLLLYPAVIYLLAWAATAYSMHPVFVAVAAFTMTVGAVPWVMFAAVPLVDLDARIAARRRTQTD